MSDNQAPNPLAQLRTGALSGLNELGFGAYKPLYDLIHGKGAFDAAITQGNQPTIGGLKPADIGSGAGLIGSMFIPGGAVTKLLGKGAEALGATRAAEGLGQASNFLAGEGAHTLGSNVVRGAGQALEQAIPRAATGIADQEINGNPDQGAILSNAAGNIAEGGLFGGGLGGVLGLGGSAIRRLLGNKEGQGWVPQQVASELQKGSANTAVAGLMGTTTRALRQVANEGSNWEMGPVGKADAVEKSIQDQANFLAQHKIYNLRDLEDYHDQIKNSYDQIAGSLTPENTPIPKMGTTEFQDWVKQQPWWGTFSRQNPGAEDALDAYSQKLYDPQSPSSIYKEGVNPAAELYNVTAQDANALRMGQSPEQQSVAIMANKIHGGLMDHALDVAGKEGADIQYPPGINNPEELSKAYAANKVFRATKRIEATTAQPASIPGSDTALKSAMMNLAGQVGPGAAIGGYLGSQGDITNIPGMAAGAVMGGMANKGLSVLASKLGGQGALGLNQALQNTNLGDKITGARDFAQKVANSNFAGLPEGAGAMAGSPPQPVQAPPMANGPMPQGQAQPMPQNGQMAGGPPPADPQTVLNSMGQYGKIVSGKIMQMYDQIDRTGGQLMAHGITPQVFANGLMQASNNFDPNLMANVLFPDEGQRGAFLKSFQTVQQLKGIDVNSVLGTNPLAGIGASILNPSYASARVQLANVMAQTASPTEVNNALKQLDQIQWLNAPIAQKKEILAKIIQKTANLNTSMVHQMGLDQGTLLEALPS